MPDDPEQPVWSIIRKLSDKIGEGVTTHGQRDLDDDRLSNLIEAISTKRLGLDDVEADIIGKSYEYLIRKFAEGGGQSAGEFYTPPEVGTIMSRVLQPEPGMETGRGRVPRLVAHAKCDREVPVPTRSTSRSTLGPAQAKRSHRRVH